MSDHDEAHCHRCNPPTTPCGDPTCSPCYEHEHGPAVEPGVMRSTIPRLDAAENRIEDMGKREDRQATWIDSVEDRIVGLERAIVRIEQSMRDSFHRHHYTGEITMGPGSMPQYGGALPVDQASPTVRLVAERDEARVKLKEAEATISQLTKERNDAFAVVDLERAKVADADCKVYRLTGERDVARIIADSFRINTPGCRSIFPWDKERDHA